MHIISEKICTKSPVHKISRARNCMHEIGSSKSDARNFHARVFFFLEKKYAFDKKPQKYCVTLDQEDVELKIVHIKTFKTDISKNFNFFLRRGSSL